MASYRFYQFTGSLEPELCKLTGLVFVDSSGDVLNTTVDAADNDHFGVPELIPKGIESIDHSDTGEYTFVLEQAWPRLFHVSVCLYKDQPVMWSVTSKNPQGATVNSVDARTIVLQFYDAAGSAVEVESTEFSYEFTLKNLPET